jgi:NAD(P)-dependent dehydrogenase (short-subunit alcohol dehydrogenase family)
MGELDGKVAVITGAGSGMAKASVKVFIREGAAGVIAADVSGAQNDTARELGDKVIPVHCDVRQEEDVIAMIDAAVQRFGKVDAVLNVAGIGGLKPLLDVDNDTYDLNLDVMLRGVFFGITHGLRAMLKTGGGTILNWSSVGALGSIPGSGVYSAAKAGVVALTRATAVEHGAQGIRSVAILPGYIKSEGMGAPIANYEESLKPKIPSGRVGLPIDVAEVAAFLCSDRASYINGVAIAVDGGQSIRL